MSNQEHVCIAITKSNMGGAQKYVLTLATELKNRCHRVTVIAGGDGELFQNLDHIGIDYIRLSNSQRDISIFKEFKLLIELYRILKGLRPDILHLNSSKIGGMGGVAGRCAGTGRIIFTAHGWAFNENRPKWQKIASYFFYWLIIQLCDRTICVSKKTREQILALPFVKNKTSIVYNGIPVPDFYTREDARTKLAAQFPFLDLNKKWIAVLAELHPVKGHDILIEALSDMHTETTGYQVLFLGSGQAEQDLKMLVSQKSLTTQVFFAGFVENASMYLKAFELSILPSRSEAMPLAVLESGLAGTLVIASEVGGIPEILTNGETGYLFAKEDCHMLADRLRTTFALSPEKKATISNRLAEKVRGTFSVEDMTTQTIAVYKHRP